MKKAKDVLDPKTNTAMKTVMWPPTKQMKEIPIIQHFCDGSLQDMEYWVFDEATATTVIKFPAGVFLVVTAKDLLQFGECDINTLAQHQIVVKMRFSSLSLKSLHV